MLGSHGKHCECVGCGTLKSVGLLKNCAGKGCSHPSHRKAVHHARKKR